MQVDSLPTELSGKPMGWGQKRSKLFHLCLWDIKGSIRQITSLLLTREFQIDEFEIMFLGEVEIVIRLAIKSWFADAGLSINDPTLGLNST